MQLFCVLFVPFGFCDVVLFLDLQVISSLFFGLSLLSLLTSLGLSFGNQHFRKRFTIAFEWFNGQ
jgi:hypothetical protein